MAARSPKHLVRRSALPPPYGSLVTLPPEARTHLESLSRARSPQALAFRCRLILRAADPDTPSNQDITAELDCHRHTVGRWRERFVTHGLAGLQELEPRCHSSWSSPPSG